MNFDARSAKVLTPGQHIIISDYPGFRLVAFAKVRTWIYRYKSPVDKRMRQISIGHWPSMSFPTAIVAWEQLKIQRDNDIDHALETKPERNNQCEAVEKQHKADKEEAYTQGYYVMTICRDT
jgi:hypothetical protein